MGKGIKLVGSSVIIAVIASVSAILIFQGIQSALFSEVLRETGLGNHTSKYASIRVYNITNEYVSLSIEGDEQVCKLKERESCYSRCLRVTVADIRSDSADIDIVDEITCEVGRFAGNIGTGIRNAIGGLFGSPG